MPKPKNEGLGIAMAERPTTQRRWVLARRPPSKVPDLAQDFKFEDAAPVPVPGPGQALAKTIYCSMAENEPQTTR